MKKLLFILLFLPFFCFGQNLVPNPSFEDTITCPAGNWAKVVAWDTYSASSDYFNSCSGINSVPDNPFGYQFAATGVAYCGLYSFHWFNSDYREFVGAQLNSPLIISQKYFVSFKVALAEGANCATNKLGILFSTVPHIDTLPNDTIWGPTNNFAHVYTDSIQEDTAMWQLISGSFIADSAYQYVIVGNFFNDSITDTTMLAPINCAAYYFVDDIYVGIDSLMGVTEEDIESSISISPNPTTGKFTLQGATGEIEVYDLFGRLVLRTNKHEIDMSSYPAGIYIWQVGSGRGKIILE